MVRRKGKHLKYFLYEADSFVATLFFIYLSSCMLTS